MPGLEGNKRMTKATEKKKDGATKSRKRGSSASKKTSAAAKQAGVKKKVEVEHGEPAPLDAAANAAFAGQAAMAGTRAAGKAITLAAGQVKGPLAAGGGLAAGIAGGLVLVNRRRGRRRAMGFDIAGAAERIGALGEEVGRVAIVIQRAADGSKSSR
jgi:hypothetical protein